ncbi:MAG: glycosyltransferase [Patescibacteria group bacterium]|nr:glycosyltransferase [Patescibacteria group bacterium]
MQDIKDKKVAIVADWLTSRGGAERVVLAMTELFPNADIFTSVYKPEAFPELKDRNVKTSFLQKWPLGKKHQLWPTLRPLAFEMLDLDNYDIVISSASAEAKGVITKPETLHICYCHTPTRYYWSEYHNYLKHPEFGFLNPIVKFVMPRLIHRARLWDKLAADRVDYFIANSQNTKKRIKKYYERDAKVLLPPVEAERFSVSEEIGDYYLILGRQTSYKRTDVAIDAFNKLGLPLKVIGVGPTLEKSKSIAKENINFLGKASDTEVTKHLANAKALIFPQEEDAGIVPMEAMASGRPVIAYGKGGALETVIDKETGLFFREQTGDSLALAIQEFEKMTWDSKKIKDHVDQFSTTNFKRNLYDIINDAYAKHEDSNKI